MKSAEHRLKEWFSLFDKSIVKELDFSPTSLVHAENILLSKFNTKEELRKDENWDFVFDWILYVGEVFRINDNIRQLEWQRNEKLFPILECSNYSNSRVDVSKKIPVLLNKRSGDVLMNYYIKNTEYFKENHLTLRKTKSTFYDKGYSYQYFLLIINDNFDFNSLFKCIKPNLELKYNNTIISKTENKISIELESDYSFYLQFDNRETVLIESAEFAENYKGNKEKTIISKCKERIEFWGEEDIKGAYINHYLGILEILSQNPEILIFDFKKGLFFDE
nr:hypothetical protein [uncultured Carboxylicivirga sp.]